MDTLKKAFARKMLEVKAVKLQPNDPFTWASGWKSPIYTDNRKALSFPELRTTVKLALTHAVLEQFPEAEAVAGVATGAIAQGALVADELNMPYVYVRPKPKDHGFPVAEEAFREAGVKLVTISDYEHVVAEAVATGYIKAEDEALLKEWRKNPSEWGK